MVFEIRVVYSCLERNLFGYDSGEFLMAHCKTSCTLDFIVTGRT